MRLCDYATEIINSDGVRVYIGLERSSDYHLPITKLYFYYIKAQIQNKDQKSRQNERYQYKVIEFN